MSDTVFSKNPKTTLLVTTIILLALLLLLLETALRFTPYQIYVSKGQGGFPPMFVSDEKAGFDLVENFGHGMHSTIDLQYPVHTNNIACYDHDVELNKRHNLIIGDSFTWGFSPLEKKWTSILEKNTQQRFLKCGVMAYGPKHSLAKLKKINRKVGKNPKTIIYAYYWNDLNDDHTFPALTTYQGDVVNRIKTFNYKNGDIQYLTREDIASNYQQYQKYGNSEYYRLSTKQKMRFWIKSNSIIANLLYKTLYSNNPVAKKEVNIVSGSEALYHTYLTKMSTQKHPWLIKAWDKHLRNIEEMNNYAESINSKFMMVIIPTKNHVYPENSSQAEIQNIEQSRKFLIQHLISKDIPFLDMHQDFIKAASSGIQLYLPHDLHFSIEGEALAGKLLINFIEERKFLIH